MPAQFPEGSHAVFVPRHEMRGLLRYALYNATKYVCLWDPAFAAYLAKKRAEGKHYNVAPSHAAKKVGSTDLRYGEVPTAIPHSRITVFLSYT